MVKAHRENVDQKDPKVVSKLHLVNWERKEREEKKVWREISELKVKWGHQDHKD